MWNSRDDGMGANVISTCRMQGHSAGRGHDNTAMFTPYLKLNITTHNIHF